MRHRLRCLVVLAVLALGRVSAQSPPARVAIIGATLVDGNGGAPLRDAVLVVEGARIAQVGPRGAVTIPTGAEQVDARGRWIVPGFIDTNVHLSLYGGQNDRYESLVRYQPRQDEIVLEAAASALGEGGAAGRGRDRAARAVSR